MSSQHEKLISEINEHLDELTQRQRPWVAQFVTHAICDAHEDGLTNNEHRYFWDYSGHKFVRSTVTKVINDRAGDEADRARPQQITLPGFSREHLQDYYIVTRNGRDEGIIVTDLTTGELLAKAELYRSMSVACRGHADEIERFVTWRNNQAKSA